MSQIFKWQEIEQSFRDSLLLGNGASIAVDPCFTYCSLLQVAKDKHLITNDIKKIFDYLDTQDFELVLNMIWHTFHVNKSLGVQDTITERVYGDIKTSLIEAIQANHAKYETVQEDLPKIGAFMHRFDKVISLNYDLIVYWALLLWNDTYGPWFKDCWINNKFLSEIDKLDSPYKNAQGRTLVFYPHGNLVLASELNQEETKITKTCKEELLKQIITKWENDTCVPLFVSEGNWQQKESAIKRSHYLTTIFQNVISKLGPSLVIYGWTMSENDLHILKQLGKAQITRVAISIYRIGKSDSEIVEECRKYEYNIKTYLPDATLHFFDSTSSGCWNN